MKRISLVACLLASAGVSLLTGAAPRQPPIREHRHPEAQAIKNPVPNNTESIALGAKLYAVHCAECHGDGGKGDGMASEGMKPPPAILVDEAWTHGSTDGEIFVVIRDGTTDGMKEFGKKLTEREIWDLVNYLRSLGRKPVKSH